jgi:hypothetical protein
MTKLKMICRNISVLNIGLIVFLILFFTVFVFPRLKTVLFYTLPPVKPAVIPAGKIAAEMKTPAVSDYLNISENNIFHPERTIPPEKKVGSAELQPLPQPDVILYGTLITDDTRIAYLEDLKSPHDTRGRGRRQLTMRKGDTLSGFTLKEIDADRIVMARGQEQIIVRIHEKKPPSAQEVKRPTIPTSKARTQPALRNTPPQPEAPPKKQLRGADQDVLDFFKKRTQNQK